MLNQIEASLAQGKFQLALQLASTHCESHSQDARAWFLLSVCQHRLNQHINALQSIERALSIEPMAVQVRSAKAMLLHEMGRSQEALQIYRKTLRLVPHDAQLMCNMGVVLEQMGERFSALERYDSALVQQPGFPAALLNRGGILLGLKRLDEALVNNRQLVALYPDWEPAQFNLGETLLALAQWSAALEAYRRAATLNPKAAKNHFSIALALTMLKRFDEASQAFVLAKECDSQGFAACCQNAAALMAGNLNELSPEAIYLLRQSERLDVCDWGGASALVEDFERIVEAEQVNGGLSEPALIFRFCALPVAPNLLFELAQRCARKIEASVKNSPSFVHAERPAGRLKIAYVSPDFRVHPVAMMTRRLYGLHDRSRFEVYGYSLTPSDGSALRREIELGCDHFRDLSALDDVAAAEVIHRDGIDVLVDLAGYTKHSRPALFAMKAAPIRASYLGFPHSMGGNFIDYYIADSVVITKQNRSFFTEKIVALPGSFFMFDNHLAVSEHRLTRAECGLPEQGFVFCCYNGSHKITQADFERWMRILSRVPGSVLWLAKADKVRASNLGVAAEACGVARDRLIFAEFVTHDVHLARLGLADLFLDTAVYNAHTTAAEALWAGVPVLTFPGVSMASRVAASLLQACGLNELVADSADNYEAIACRLATQPSEISRIKKYLVEKKNDVPLFDTEMRVRELEVAYLKMWEQFLSGKSPESFSVSCA